MYYIESGIIIDFLSQFNLREFGDGTIVVNIFQIVAPFQCPIGKNFQTIRQG